MPASVLTVEYFVLSTVDEQQADVTTKCWTRDAAVTSVRVQVRTRVERLVVEGVSLSCKHVR